MYGHFQLTQDQAQFFNLLVLIRENSPFSLGDKLSISYVIQICPIGSAKIKHDIGNLIFELLLITIVNLEYITVKNTTLTKILKFIICNDMYLCEIDHLICLQSHWSVFYR